MLWRLARLHARRGSWGHALPPNGVVSRSQAVQPTATDATGSALVLWLSGHVEANHVWVFGISVQTLCLSDWEQRIATRIATVLNPWVFGTVCLCTDKAVYVHKPVTYGHRRTPHLNLGVKWSQVQILSARPGLPQVKRSMGVVISQ